MLDSPQQERTQRFLRRTQLAHTLEELIRRRRRRTGVKRLTIVLATVALAAGVLVALSGVASAREAEPYAAEQARLPPLPAEIKERKRLNIAVKCDSPPFGYIGARSQQAGFDVEIARWFSRLRVRQGEPRHIHVRHDPGTRAGDSRPARRHGDRDVHVQHRSRHAYRLLAGVLQGDGPSARSEQLLDPVASRTSRARPW